MFQLYALIAAMLLAATAQNYAMQEDQMDIIDNLPFEQTPEQAAAERNRVQSLKQRNAARAPLFPIALKQIRTAAQADFLGELATNHCQSKVAHAASKLSHTLAQNQRVPAMAQRRLRFNEENSDQEQQ